MIFSSAWFNEYVMLVAWVLYVPVAVWCAVRGGGVSLRQMLVAATLSAFLWLMNVQVEAGHLAGMVYHLLGLNLAALMLGAPNAFLLGSAWTLTWGMARHGGDFAAVFALNAWAVALPACALNALGRRWALAKLPKQVFIYIFVNGFLSGAFGMLLTGLLVCAVLYGANVFSGSVAWGSAFPVFFLLTWGEAFLSGIAAAVCVAFKPELLATFDDTMYLSKAQNRIWK